MHDGLWAGLHQADPDSPAGCLVVDRILDCLQRAAEGGKAIYLCGHSLGGGLVSMLSLIAATRWGPVRDTAVLLTTPASFLVACSWRPLGHILVRAESEQLLSHCCHKQEFHTMPR